jgi:LysR family hydrogen peroxide-inducible transcriptional activator
LETIVGLVESGQGYTLLPELAANQHKERKIKGQIVKISRPAPAREISLVHRRGHLKQGILKALKLAVDASVPAALAREKSKAFRVLGLSGEFQ